MSSPFEKMFHYMSKPWAIALYLALIILAYYCVDRPLATYFYQHDLRENVHALNILTVLGQWKIYVMLFLIAGFYFRYVKVNRIYEVRSWYLLGCVFIPNLIGIILKICLSRARPELLFASNYYGFYWFQSTGAYWSFPSGHTITITGLVYGLCVIYPKYFYALLLIAVLVIATRVLLYHHFLSDVMAGFYLSMLVVTLYTGYLRRNKYLIE